MAKKNLSTIKKLLRAFKEGATIMAACKSAGIGRAIYYRWLKQWPNLSKRIDEIKESRTDLVVDALYKNCIEGKSQDIKFYLVNKGWKPDSGTKVEVPVEIKNNTQINIPVASQEESERVKAYAELIRRHNLVSRVLGSDGHQLDAGGQLQGQQRDENSPSSDSSGNS